MRTTAQIDIDIAALQALPPGVHSVTFQDRSTMFSTEAEKQAAMTRLLAERAAAVASGANTLRRRRVLMSSSKGL